MREKKLRAWDNVNKRMLFFSDLAWHDEYDLLYFGEGRLDVSVGDNLDFMDFTGLKDKNNKETYHKDILRGNAIRGKVGSLWIIEWDNEWARFTLVPVGIPFWERDKHRLMIYLKGMEYAGNTYENPELIPELIEEKL